MQGRPERTVVCPNDALHKLHKQQQKGVDVGIATLALIHAEKCEMLVLSSGDGDLLDAVEHLTENEGKRLELLVFRHGVSTDLQSRAAHIYWIDDFAEDVVQDRREPVPAPIFETEDGETAAEPQ